MTGKEIVRVAIGYDAFDFTWSDALVEMIDAAIEQAVRAERNAIIALHNYNGFVTADTYCDAIRARGTT
jgi:hypothetical protein